MPRRDNGKVDVALDKAETGSLLDVANTLDAIVAVASHHFETGARETTADAAACLRACALRFGAKYLDDSGNLIPSKPRKAADENPAEEEKPAETPPPVDASADYQARPSAVEPLVSELERTAGVGEA